jgi:DNA modification methylase
LKNTGSCWANLGDTYYTTSCKSYQGEINGSAKLPQKSLSLIPFRFALAMVNKGWVLRNVIVWHKPNCLPSSAKDRFTADFEYLFFFTKSQKYYFKKQLEPFPKSNFKKSMSPYINYPARFSKEQYDSENKSELIDLQGRNKRCVWKISSKPFKEAHFAVFPESLCEIPIRAGCPEKVCIKCGMPKLQRIEGGNPAAFNYRIRDVKTGKIKHIDRKASLEELESSQDSKYTSRVKVKNILGCQCNAGFSAGIVLDPFIGSGTTAVVAKKLKRNYIGFELNPDYVRIAKKRMENIDGAEKENSY